MPSQNGGDFPFVLCLGLQDTDFHPGSVSPLGWDSCLSLAETDRPNGEAKVVREVSAPHHCYVSHRKQVEVLKL